MFEVSCARKEGKEITTIDLPAYFVMISDYDSISTVRPHEFKQERRRFIPTIWRHTVVDGVVVGRARRNNLEGRTMQ
jgi:hypothetical protein